MGKKRRRNRKPATAEAAGRAVIPTIVDDLPTGLQDTLALATDLESRREVYRACRVYAHAVQLAPGDAMLHAHHAYALGRTRRMDEAMAAYSRAVELAPVEAAIPARLGQMFTDSDLDAQAVPLLERALTLDRDHGPAHMNLCWSLRRLGRLDAAIEHGRRAVQLCADPNAGFYLGYALLAAERDQEALEVSSQMLARDPRCTLALGLQVAALDRTGQRERGRWLADFDRLVLNATLRAPPGFDSLAAFNAELADMIMAAPGRPLDDTQTLDVFEAPQGAMLALWQVFNVAVQQYLAALPHDPEHPFLRWRPQRWVLDGWGNRTVSNAEQEHHFHQHGWISGVYYVDVPPFVAEGRQNIEGCLEFCRFNAYSERPVEAEFMVVRPQAGALVLFPSYLYHRVCAFEGPSRRISIAFNLTPTA